MTGGNHMETSICYSSHKAAGLHWMIVIIQGTQKDFLANSHPQTLTLFFDGFLLRTIVYTIWL